MASLVERLACAPLEKFRPVKRGKEKYESSNSEESRHQSKKIPHANRTKHTTENKSRIIIFFPCTEYIFCMCVCVFDIAKNSFF